MQQLVGLCIQFFLFYWKSELQVFPRFTIISFGGIISLLPFYLFEEFYLFQTQFDQNFFLWVLFAAVSPINMKVIKKLKILTHQY